MLVSVKALVKDSDGKLLLLQEDNGDWDLPGGRLRDDESFSDALRRECQEELGVECEVLSEKPELAWTARDSKGNWRVVLCFPVRLESNEFMQSPEHVAHKYFSKDDLQSVSLRSHTAELKCFEKRN